MLPSEVRIADIALGTHVLLVGVERYTDSAIENLSSPCEEVRSLAKALCAKDGVAIPSGQVLIVENPTIDELRESLSAFVDERGPDDTAILYYAGHAFRREQNQYLTATNSYLEDLAATSLSALAFGAIISKCRAARVLVILDCCISAGFAERAPSYFQRLVGTEFRALLCASLEDQPSWERADGGGTLFSGHMLAILEGREPAGQEPGEITFGGLLAAIEFRVNEDLLHLHPGLPPQQPVAAAVYSKDPVLFVHRKARLKGLTTATARVSQARFHRVVRNVVIGIILSVTFGLLSYYRWLDGHMYLSVVEKRLLLYKGHPRWTAPGYPHPIREYAFDPAQYEPEGAILRSGSAISVFDEPVEAFLKRQLNALGRAEARFQADDLTGTRTIAIKYFDSHPSVSNVADINMRLLFAEVATPADRARLEEDLKSFRKEVREAAILGLQRFDKDMAIDLLRQDLKEGSAIDHSRILSRYGPPCTQQLQRYISAVALVPSARVNLPDTVLRTGCTLDEEGWWFLVRNAAIFGNGDLTDLARIATLLDLPFRYSLAEQQLKSEEQPSEALRWSIVLSNLRPPRCPSTLVKNWNNGAAFQWLRIGIIRAIAQGCGGHSAVQVIVDQSGGRASLRLSRWPERVLVLQPDSISTSDSLLLLQLLRDLSLRDSVPFIRKMLELHPYPVVRASSLDLLTDWSVQIPVSSEMLMSNSIDLQVAAQRALNLRTPDDAAEFLVGSIGAIGLSDLIKYLRGLVLTPKASHYIRELLASDDATKRKAAAVLAARGSPDAIGYLLAQRSFSVRSEALEYAAANQQLNQAVANLQSSQDIDQRDGKQLINLQVRRNEILDEIRSMPEWARAWRMQHIARTRKVWPPPVERLDAGIELFLADQSAELRRSIPD